VHNTLYYIINTQNRKKYKKKTYSKRFDTTTFNMYTVSITDNNEYVTVNLCNQ